MIFEFFVSAGVAAAAAYALRTIRDQHEARGIEGRGDEAPTTPEPRAVVPIGPRGYRAGDVLLFGMDELWLAGTIELREEGDFVARLFRAPGGIHPWVVQLDAEGREVLLGEETELGAGRVPDELPFEGLRVSLRRRGSAQVETRGEHLPPPRPSADFAILRGQASAGAIVVVDFRGGDRLAIRGHVVDRVSLELLPGGDE